MAPRIVIIGGGSYQWVPKLLIDIVNTPSLAEAELVFEDIDPTALPAMVDLAEHLSSLRGVGVTATHTTDQRAALAGADFVVVSISTGGFTSMRHDLEVPARYGIKQSVGDTVGPGGVMRALRNIPVLVGVASDMEELCPDAWLLNITNPMTTLCRAITRETEIKTVGLCHEIAGTRFTLSLLLGAPFLDIDMEMVGVNHLPIITALRTRDGDGFEQLRALIEDEALAAEPVTIGAEMGEMAALSGRFTKRELMDSNQVKLELFRRFGVLPGAGDRHLVEFFPGFLTEASQWGKRWGVALTTIEDRERAQGAYQDELTKARAVTEVPRQPSGEMVAPIIDSFVRGRSRDLPLNLPNTGQCPDLPGDVVVEAICTADGAGIHARDNARAPTAITEFLRRVVSAQEATVEAALSGDRDRVVEAMLLDPLAGRIDFDQVSAMTDDMLAATSRWLPQFA